MKPVGYLQITTPSTRTLLTIPSGAQVALIQAEPQNCRWRDDGTDPTAAIGMQIAAGNSVLYVGELSAFKVIQEAANAKVNVSFYAMHST